LLPRPEIRMTTEIMGSFRSRWAAVGKRGGAACSLAVGAAGHGNG